MFHVGLDLAWADSKHSRPNESGIVVLDPDGNVTHAAWTIGVAQTVDWIERNVPANALLFVDAPLVVSNATGQRLCEKHVGQRYGRWRVSANSTNHASPRQAGVKLLKRLTNLGWTYHDGMDGPPDTPGRHVAECYPYTTIVGARQLGYDRERPRYKRKPKGMGAVEFRGVRATECDELIRRMASLRHADPAMVLASHPETRRLLTEQSPLTDREYKHREDLLDAALCAWTAAFWTRWGKARSQVLGTEDLASGGRQANHHRSGTSGTAPIDVNAPRVVEPTRWRYSSKPSRDSCTAAINPSVRGSSVATSCILFIT